MTFNEVAAKDFLKALTKSSVCKTPYLYIYIYIYIYIYREREKERERKIDR